MALAGKGGTLKFDSSGGSLIEVSDLREWNVNIERDLFEISTFGSSGWREFQQNLVGASGSASGYWNAQSSTSQKDLQSNILSQEAAATIALLVDETNGNGYTGEVFITSLSPAASVDGIVEFNFDYTFTGAVSYSTTL